MATITLDFPVDDEPTGVVLTSITRLDTDASVTLPSPATFEDGGEGVWTIEFDEPAEGLEYEWTATATWDDATTSPLTGTVNGQEFSGDFGTSAGMQEKCGGSKNLETYEFQPASGITREDTVGQTQIAASIADDLTEANADMAAAWAEFTDVDLGYLKTYELRWLNDTAEYGGVCKAWAGRNVSRGQTDDVPQQIATAIDEWTRRLEMLRTGSALVAYYADESADNDSGVLELQEGLGPVAAFPCPPLCVDVSNDDCDCTCG
jgi:hypothetical protein